MWVYYFHAFPNLLAPSPSVMCNGIHPDPQHHQTDPSANKHKSEHPKNPPFPPTSENIEILKWLLDQFTTTVFNNSGKFPAIPSLKEGSIPKAKNNTIPVLYHYKEQVRGALWEDVKRGIITPVPIGRGTSWYRTMVITTKKNGKPSRLLASKFPMQTGNITTPARLFPLSVQVPPNTKTLSWMLLIAITQSL